MNWIWCETLITKTNKNKQQRLERLPVTVRWHFSQTRVVARSNYHGSGVGTHLLHSTCAMSPSSAEGSSSRLLPYFPSPYAHSHQVTHFFFFARYLHGNRQSVDSMFQSSWLQDTAVAQTRGVTLTSQYIRSSDTGRVNLFTYYST